MRITHIAFRNYKQLKEVKLDLLKEDGKEDFPVYFCIGLNGTGKSTFLEAVALIFARISQNELPGFWFEIKYDIYCADRWVHVQVREASDKQNGRLDIIADGKQLSSFEGLERYLPYKVITYVSGPNNQMKQLLLKAAEDSIISDIYDAAKEDGAVQIEGFLRSLETLKQNPRILYLDEEMAVMILFVLCAWAPQQAAMYEEQRSMLFKKWNSAFMPVALAMTAGNEIEGSLFAQFFEKSKEGEGEGFADWITRGEDTMTGGFCIGKQGGGYCAEQISNTYTNPLQLLTVMLQAKNRGELKECHVFFHKGRGQDLLNEKALSDGELLWIARMGLVLLASQEKTDNCLFLFDEPDIQLNENWNVEFVSSLEMLTRQAGRGHRNHSFWVSTHSSLLLTDALPDQVFLFERNDETVSVKKVPISFFGASRHEISKNAFRNSAQIGEFAGEKIGEVLDKEEKPEKLMEYINMVGAGISRFRLLDKYYEKKGD